MIQKLRKKCKMWFGSEYQGKRAIQTFFNLFSGQSLGLYSYPSAAQQHVHTTKAFIPKDIARALSQNPSLIQRAVETFYTRDAIQLRVSISLFSSGYSSSLNLCIL